MIHENNGCFGCGALSYTIPVSKCLMSVIAVALILFGGAIYFHKSSALHWSLLGPSYFILLTSLVMSCKKNPEHIEIPMKSGSNSPVAHDPYGAMSPAPQIEGKVRR